MHKWWAKRLGSVFRGVLLGCLLPEEADLQTAFFESQEYPAVRVFDPFMGSGTTIGEAHKLGCIALGRDINPVACESVRVALGTMDQHRLQAAYNHLSLTVGERIRSLYLSSDENGVPCEVLYYFWVKQAPCPCCDSPVDLFPSYIIARNAYPDRKTEVQVYCPRCGDIFPARSGAGAVRCRSCSSEFDSTCGVANGAQAICPACTRKFSIAEAVRLSGRPPGHRLYAKLLLTEAGEKRYLPATHEDACAYVAVSESLRGEQARGSFRLPDAVLSDGHNTKQAMGYNYLAWRDFFNDRQLLALGWLHEAIAGMPDEATRDVLLTLLSGVLEFNNLFATYKGEGTGAVRHMFSHHILKPERLPIEANVWGTPKSSGSFSNLFRSRLMRTLAYRAAPFEVSLDAGRRGPTVGKPFSGGVEEKWPADGKFVSHGIHLSCGSSDASGLPPESIDLVVTDPPFFDNVHYSELADFFHAWQTLYPRGFITPLATTRHEREVQDANADGFAEKLRAVFSECHRVLKADGLLVFSYHHSRTEGWEALARAVYGAGFSIVKAHPVRAEMSVATPKSQAKAPIQLDILLVCCKREYDPRSPASHGDNDAQSFASAQMQIRRLEDVGLRLSRNDRRVVLLSQFLASLGPITAPNALRGIIDEHAGFFERAVADLSNGEPSEEEEQIQRYQNVRNRPNHRSDGLTAQMELPL
jgi:putative DNA methylase